MASSITKDGFDSSRPSTSTGNIEAALRPSQSALPSTPSCPTRHDACCYGPTVRADNGASSVYIAGRATNIILTFVLLALSLVAEFRYDKGTWMNPILTPAFTTWGYSCYDLWMVFRHGRRVHPHVRILYDGVCLGTGLAVASGFLTAWAVQSAPEIGYTVSAPILVFMYTMMAIEYGIGIGGVVQVVKMRRGTWRYQ